jgi:penicillin-insensitive murein endopeptidase
VKAAGWPGLLIGDMAQPRGGPMLTGHASHQIGLDADIWLMPMPDRTLTFDERKTISAVSVLAGGASGKAVDPKVWSPAHVGLIRMAASFPEVARIFVNPAIKVALCEAAGNDRDWLRKVRPWWGHHYHFHVRLSCPKGAAGCANQAAPPAGDGCGAELASWFKPPPKPKKTAPPPKKRPELTLADLPKACTDVLNAE